MSLFRCWLICAAAGCGIFATPCGAEVRIKDITQVEGARGNPLYGLGLVVGLNKTGARALSTQQMAIDMLRKLDVNTAIARQSLLDNVFTSNNISAVMVTAEISAFARKGSRLDVSVSVLDDATSLEGGTLLMTPLKGADGDVYAVVQGPLSIGGFRVRSSGNGGQQNHPTVARILNGGIVEREALGEIDQGGRVRLLLRDADYSTATVVTKAINFKFPNAAKAVDAGTIQVQVPILRCRNVPDFLSEIGVLQVTPDAPARIVINERTGTVIVGHQVQISAVAIAHGNLVIKPNGTVIPTPEGVLPPPDGGPAGPRSFPSRPALLPPPPSRDEDEEGDDRLTPPPAAAIPPGSELPATFHMIEPTYTVAELARVLNLLGVSPRDLIAIFQALKESGALHAELVIM